MIASLKKNAPCLPAACLPAKAGQRQGKGRAKAGSQWRYRFNLAFRYIYG
jgi:hypothetical protein